jgi:MFS family permease
VSYFGELRSNWPNLLGTCFGLGTGAALSFFTMSLFGPALIADLGWSKAGFALVGSLPMVSFPLLPFVGRFADRVGARIAGSIGFVAVVLCFLALAMMRGTLWEFLVINAVLAVFGVMTSSMVFGRIVVDRFNHSRGLALSLMMTTSPLSGALVAPLIGSVIAHHGWRAGYFVLAGLCACGGMLAITLIGRSGGTASPSPNDRKLSWSDLAALARHPNFVLLMGGMFLVNLPQVFASSQLKLIALDTGANDAQATWMVSLYALGSIGGRLCCGLALDRIKANLVAFVALAIPALSYIAFASHMPSVTLLASAVLFIGLAQGAEGDVGAFIISRQFDARNFSLLYAFLNMMVSAGTSIGSLVLSFTLHQGFGYQHFTILCAVATFTGAILFGFTGFVGRNVGPEKPEGDTDFGAEGLLVKQEKPHSPPHPRTDPSYQLSRK